MASLEERVQSFVERPSTLRDLCRVAGEESAYRRVQQAFRRWKKGEGSGIPPRDRAWLEEALEEAE